MSNKRTEAGEKKNAEHPSELEKTFKNMKIEPYFERSAWCHKCSRPFIYFFSGMDEPDWECPRCNSNEHVTVP